MNEFVVDYRSSKEFESSIALSFSVEGAGAASLLWGIVFNIQNAVLLGLLFVFAGIVILLFHLGSPQRFWRVIVGAKSSWISRGSFIIGCLAGVGCIYYLVPFLFQENVNSPLMTLLIIITAVFSVSVMLYPGFLLSSMTPVPFWNTPLVPIVFITHALATGMSLYCASLSFLFVSAEVFQTAMILNGSFILASLGLTAVHLTGMINATTAAKKSAKSLVSGKYSIMFMLGGIIAGMLLPLCLTGYMYISPSSAALVSITVLMAIFRLAGDFLYRYSVLKAGMFEPLI